jgi:hypothetical protein
MSYLLKVLEPSEEDYSDHSEKEDIEAQYLPEKEEQRNGNEEELRTSTNLWDITVKKKKKKKKKKKNGKSHKQLKESYSLDDELPVNNNNKVKYMDKKEKEHYDMFLMGEDVKQTKMEDAGQVHFRLAIRESAKMNFDTVKPTSAVLMTINKKWLEEYNKFLDNIYEMNLERKRKKLPLLNWADWHKHIRDNGEPIPKFKKLELSQEHQEIQHCFKRFNFASTSYNDKIWVHGGNNGKAVLSDFWSFETKTGKLTIFRNVHHNRHEFIDIPPLEGHQMVYVTRNGIDSLLIIGHDCRSFRYNAFRKDLQFFLISNVNNIDNIHYGKSYNNSGIDFTMYCHPISDHTIPSKIHFTATVMGVENGVKYELLIFGGLNWSNNVATNDLYLIGFNLEEMVWVNGLYAPSVSVRNLLPNQSSSAGILSQPAARYGHSAIAINGNLYIFGGKSNSAFYNDLWFFDIQQKLWLEIDITGSIPPGIAFFGLFSYSPQTLLIYGGSSAKSTSNSIYSYDTGTKEWSIVKVKGHGSGKDSRPEKLQKACYGLQTAVSGTQMYRIGGKFADDVLFTVDVLSNIQDPGHRYYLCDYLRKLKQSGIFADVIFRVSEKLDSEKCARELEESDVIHEFVAHRAVILARCKYLSNLINESTNIVQPEGITENYTTRERIVVDISDCNASVFEAYLHFLYTGELELVGQKNLESLVGICRKWCPDTHFPIISELCYPTGRLQLTTIEKVVVQFEQDFEKLIDNADSFPDITLKLVNEKDANFVYAH